VSYIVQHFREVIATPSLHEMLKEDPAGLAQEVLAAHSENPQPVKRTKR